MLQNHIHLPLVMSCQFPLVSRTVKFGNLLLVKWTSFSKDYIMPIEYIVGRFIIIDARCRGCQNNFRSPPMYCSMIFHAYKYKHLKIIIFV